MIKEKKQPKMARHHNHNHDRNHHHKPRKKNQTWDMIKSIFATPSAKLGGIVFLIYIVVCVFAPVFAPYSATGMDLKNMYASPSWKHIFGTDSLGRDILSRLIYGGRYSLSLGLIVSITSTLLGIIVGSIAGYFGGATENVIMRLMDIISALPGILLTILIAASLGPGFIQTIVAMSFGSVPGGARMIRGQIVGERTHEYLEAAESINCSKASIMFKHLLPNVISPTLVNFTMSIGITISGVAGLSYIGLGVQPPTPEWGAMLSEGTANFRDYPHLIIFPGLVIGICVFAINLMGDGLRDALDPKLRK